MAIASLLSYYVQWHSFRDLLVKCHYCTSGSSYSSLDWVLSLWAHFTVCRFICVYLRVFYVFLFYTAGCASKTVSYITWVLYLSALEVCSRRGTIHIYIYLYLTLPTVFACVLQVYFRLGHFFLWVFFSCPSCREFTFQCQYNHQMDLLCVRWDFKPTHSLTLTFLPRCM